MHGQKTGVHGRKTGVHGRKTGVQGGKQECKGGKQECNGGNKERKGGNKERKGGSRKGKGESGEEGGESGEEGGEAGEEGGEAGGYRWKAGVQSQVCKGRARPAQAALTTPTLLSPAHPALTRPPCSHPPPLLSLAHPALAHPPSLPGECSKGASMSAPHRRTATLWRTHVVAHSLHSLPCTIPLRLPSSPYSLVPSKDASPLCRDAACM
ncbi:unnamed protein product [Closterium sp. NIES-64]|nr:unnamed protein product [Closterium sp. NIES-64]